MPDQRTEPTFDPDGLPLGSDAFAPEPIPTGMARPAQPGAAAPAAAPAQAAAPAAAPASAPASAPWSASPPPPRQEAPAARPASAPAQAEAPVAAAEIAALRAEVAALQSKNAELSEQFLRAQAEMLNTRRRAEEEMSKARKFAIEAFAESLLPVTDSLEAGLAIQGATLEQIREGSEATLRQLKSALERNKVLEINPPAGTRFDPHQHQAISMVPGTGQEVNTVVGVLQKGYSIAERVLRPALVTVAAG